MHWEALGFKDEPFKTQPITAASLSLYTGNENKIKSSQFALNSSNMVMVIEGARGLGTTSFGNYLRFNAQLEKKYLTPLSEIRVEPNWQAETLMAAVIANIVSTLELNYFDQTREHKAFREAEAIVHRVTEIYRSFGVSAFGFGTSYGKSASVSAPSIMPTNVLAQHLDALANLACELGFKHGLLIQLNNLDIGVVQNEDHIKVLLNVMRDYFQMEKTSWLLVGDKSLRRFIAQEVDRLDDIVTCEENIEPLTKQDYLRLINRRVAFYRVSEHANFPVDEEVLLYLFEITKGRLRYIFGLINRLFNSLYVGTLTDKVTIDLAKPIVVNYAKERIKRYNLSANEELVLKTVADKGSMQVKEIAELLEKKPSYISNILAQLLAYKLVEYTKEWRNHHYYASVDAYIAYSCE